MAGNSKTWFRMRRAAASGNAADIQIYSDIGLFGVTAQDFADKLQALGTVKTLNISISSDGGDVSTGFAIFNMLNRHSANKIVTVEGLAASMASVIAMAGDEVVMPSNAMMMIHNPWGSVVGESDQIASFADALKTMGRNIAMAYRGRTGLGLPEIRKMMDKETWLSAKAAVTKGFADRIEQPIAASAQARAYNLSRFTNVPASFGRSQEESTMTKRARAAEADDDFEGEGEGNNGGKTEAEIRAEVLAYVDEVRSLCRLAGKPNLADGYVKSAKTISEIVADLETKREADAKAAATAAGKRGNAGEGMAAGEVSARNAGVTGESVATEIDPLAIWAHWNKSGKKAKKRK